MSVAEHWVISPGHPGAESAGAFLGSALADAALRFEDARAAFLSRQDPASVHALRVAARKLRVAVAVIHRLAPQPHLAALAHEAREQARAVAALREADVLLEELRAFFQRQGEGPAAKRLIEAVQQRRDAALKMARAALGGSNASSGPARLRPQRKPRLDASHNAFALPSAAAARQSLDGLRRRVKKRARGINGFGDAERHDLRLSLKTLRYGLELFAPLYAHEPDFARYVARVSRLQDRLGQCNDAVAARAVLASLASTPELAEAAEAYLARGDRRAAKAARSLKRRTCRLLSARPFWRG